MRACLQRVSSAAVTVDGEVVGQIGRGLLVLLGVAAEDTREDAEQLADKIVELRIFNDDAGKMNRSLLEIVREAEQDEAERGRAGQGRAGQGRAGLLVVSQFTLLGDCRKGRRPSFIAAAPPELAEDLYQVFVERARQRDIFVATGRFRAHMDVALVNDGPVTVLLDSRKVF
ncbi:MAG: D-tyrosyl-tRNA(Tyr) deacylase [Planctomycetota bacterium]|nr:MAG: D-tyrosyl-tRNA(Tyr) deacylase [Planctomycetota bacterium]